MCFKSEFVHCIEKMLFFRGTVNGFGDHYIHTPEVGTCVKGFPVFLRHTCIEGLGPEDVSLLERCPPFRGCYVQASMPEYVSLLERFRGCYVYTGFKGVGT